MPSIYWFMVMPTIASLSYAVPLRTGLAAGLKSLSPPIRVVTIYCAVALVEGAIMLWLAFTSQQNLWLIHVFTPVEVVLMLVALSHWQPRESRRTMVLAMAPLFVVTWAFLLLTSDSIADFPVYGRTLAALLITAVGAYTLLVQSQLATSPVTTHAWFWVSLGILIYFPFLVLLNPLSAALVTDRPDLVLAMYQVNAVLMIVSNLFLRRAILCRTPHRSGGSSLPRLSAA